MNASKADKEKTTSLIFGRCLYCITISCVKIFRNRKCQNSCTLGLKSQYEIFWQNLFTLLLGVVKEPALINVKSWQELPCYVFLLFFYLLLLTCFLSLILISILSKFRQWSFSFKKIHFSQICWKPLSYSIFITVVWKVSDIVISI